MFIILWMIPLGGLVFSFLLRNDFLKQLNKNQPFELIPDMDNSPAQKSQSRNIFFPGKGAEAFYPENSISQSGKLYSIEQTEIERAGENGENPLPKTPLVYRYGKHLFETHCAYCHNSNGDGNGSIMTKIVLKEDEEGFPGPPDIRTSAVSHEPDSRIFHILSAGQNLMFPVAYKLNTTDRWALVRYFRTLQGIEEYAR